MPDPNQVVEPTWTAIVPVRAGSKGLPGKNTIDLDGKPLYMHAVDQAMAANAERVIISTDIDEILQADLPPCVCAVKRPTELCQDTIPMAPVIIDVIESANIAGTAVLLQATSPLRKAQDICNGLAAYNGSTYELVMSVTAAEKSVLKWGFVEGDKFQPLSDIEHCFSNRQTLPDVFKPNGAIYVFDARWFIQNNGFATDKIGVVKMDIFCSLDVDSYDDYVECQQRIKQLKG